MGEFLAPADSFLVFEQGPSVDVLLQWATYYDAADQCSLSRIWGGIHPPQDDIPGRQIGQIVGPNAVLYAESFFNGITTAVEEGSMEPSLAVYPNPLGPGQWLNVDLADNEPYFIIDLQGRIVDRGTLANGGLSAPAQSGHYILVAGQEQRYSGFTVE